MDIMARQGTWKTSETNKNLVRSFPETNPEGKEKP